MALTNQVVLITGCSSGIGRALAAEFAARNHHVFASARRLDALAGLEGTRMEKLALDVTDEQSVARAVASVMERAGRLDMLVNNAGFNLIGPLAEVPLEGVRRLFDTNITGLLSVTQAVFPHMVTQRSGRIVNIGSVVGLLPTPFAGPYCASKAAVHMLSDVLRMELAPFGITVTEVQPGGVRSSIADTGSQGMERYRSVGSHYQALYAHIQKRAQASQDRPMASELFARKVISELLADSAPRLVRAGRGARIYPALSRLPAPARDRILKRRFGLRTREP